MMGFGCENDLSAMKLEGNEMMEMNVSRSFNMDVSRLGLYSCMKDGYEYLYAYWLIIGLITLSRNKKLKFNIFKILNWYGSKLLFNLFNNFGLLHYYRYNSHILSQIPPQPESFSFWIDSVNDSLVENETIVFRCEIRGNATQHIEHQYLTINGMYGNTSQGLIANGSLHVKSNLTMKVSCSLLKLYFHKG